MQIAFPCQVFADPLAWDFFFAHPTGTQSGGSLIRLVSSEGLRGISVAQGSPPVDTDNCCWYLITVGHCVVSFSLTFLGLLTIALWCLLGAAAPGRFTPLGSFLWGSSSGLPRAFLGPLGFGAPLHAPVLDWTPWRDCKGRLPRAHPKTGGDGPRRPYLPRVWLFEMPSQVVGCRPHSLCVSFWVLGVSCFPTAAAMQENVAAKVEPPDPFPPDYLSSIGVSTPQQEWEVRQNVLRMHLPASLLESCVSAEIGCPDNPLDAWRVAHDSLPWQATAFLAPFSEEEQTVIETGGWIGALLFAPFYHTCVCAVKTTVNEADAVVTARAQEVAARAFSFQPSNTVALSPQPSRDCLAFLTFPSAVVEFGLVSVLIDFTAIGGTRFATCVATASTIHGILQQADGVHHLDVTDCVALVGSDPTPWPWDLALPLTHGDVISFWYKAASRPQGLTVSDVLSAGEWTKPHQVAPPYFCSGFATLFQGTFRFIDRAQYPDMTPYEIVRAFHAQDFPNHHLHLFPTTTTFDFQGMPCKGVFVITEDADGFTRGQHLADRPRIVFCDVRPLGLRPFVFLTLRTEWSEATFTQAVGLQEPPGFRIAVTGGEGDHCVISLGRCNSLELKLVSPLPAQEGPDEEEPLTDDESDGGLGPATTVGTAAQPLAPALHDDTASTLDLSVTGQASASRDRSRSPPTAATDAQTSNPVDHTQEWRSDDPALHQVLALAAHSTLPAPATAIAMQRAATAFAARPLHLEQAVDTETAAEADARPVALATFFVLALECAQEKVQIAFHTPITEAQVFQRVSEGRDHARESLFPRLFAVEPQPNDEWGTLLAVPAWCDDEALVVFDLTAIDGRLFVVNAPWTVTKPRLCSLAGIADHAQCCVYAYGHPAPLDVDELVEVVPAGCFFFVPVGAPARIGSPFAAMLTTPRTWALDPDFPQPTAGRRFCCVMEQGHMLVTWDHTPMSSYREFLSRMLGISEPDLTIQPTHPELSDVVVQGWPCLAVFAASGAICRLPVPPARLRPVETLSVVDRRALLQGLTAITVVNYRYPHATLMAELSYFLPDGYQPQADGPGLNAAGEFLLDAGRLLVAQYVPLTSSDDGGLSSAGSDPPDGEASDDDTDDEHDDFTGSPSAGEGPRRDPTGRSRSRSPRVGRADAPTSQLTFASGLLTLPLSKGFSPWDLQDCTLSLPEPPLHDSLPLLVGSAFVIGGLEFLASPALGCNHSEDWLPLPFGVHQYMPSRSLKVLTEPACTNRREATALRALRRTAQQAGEPWPFVPHPASLTDDLPSEDSAEEDTSEHTAWAVVAVLVPAYSPELLTVALRFPTSFAEARNAIQDARAPEAVLTFPHLLPVAPQLFEDIAVCVALPDTPPDLVFLCLDLLEIDHRLFAVQAPDYLCRQELLELAALPPDFAVDIFVGSDEQPLVDGVFVHVMAGTTVSFLPEGSRPFHSISIHEMLLDHARWTQDAALPAQPSTDAYGLAYGDAHLLLKADPTGAAPLREQISTASGIPNPGLLLCPARPRPNNAELHGFYCRTIIACFQMTAETATQAFTGTQ